MDVFDSIQTGIRHDTSMAPLEDRLRDMELRIDRLTLVSQALWCLLKDRHGYSEAELRDWVHLTDLKDGRIDGKVSATPQPPALCPSCNRVMGRLTGRCLYCD